MSMKKNTIDLQLHMAVKSLAIFQGEINCKIDELIKKAIVLKEKEEKCEKTDSLLEMISDNLNELQELVKQRNNLSKQIKKLEKNEIDLMK
jgi:seryl-tRNA synthetase